MSYWINVRGQIDQMLRQHFDTPEYRRLFGVKLTPARDAIMQRHYPHYIKSRRDCWAAASAKAPLDVKRAIWEHEKDELICDYRIGAAHLTDEDMASATAEANLLPGTRAAIFAWLYICRERPWIESLMANHVTERKNNPEVLGCDGLTQRWAKKKVADLGGTIETLDPITKVHMVADVDHSNMFEPIFERYIGDERTAGGVVAAARDSLAIDRAYRGALATAMMELPET
jgi:hypothetical protein